MFNSLNDYINFLDSKGELLRISEFTDPVYQITKITDIESKKPDGGKALLFENTGTKFPVVTNIMGSESRIQYSIQNTWEALQNRIESMIFEGLKPRGNFIEKLKILPTLVQASKWLPKKHTGKAPCQECIIDGLDLLPILKCWPLDGGRFITLPLVHTIDPKTGARNVGMYRMQVFSENSTGMHWHRHKTGARHYDEYEKSGGDISSRMPVVVTLGGDPAYTYAATAPLPDGIDEYLLAGFLRNKPVSLVKCRTQPISVPADSDFVIEGYVDVNEEKVIEGPFGDHTGFYSLEDLYPTFHITCITHRKDAIYPATVVGMPPMEDKYIAMATEKLFLTPIKFAIAPEVIDLHLPEEGVGHNFAIVKIKKSYPGQAQKVANALWGAGQMMFCKFIIVVDENCTEIRNKEAILMSIQNYFMPKRDVYLTKGPLDVLDHTSTICGYGGKMCIDATEKLSEEVESDPSLFYKNTPTVPIEDTAFRYNIIPKIEIILDKEEDNYHSLWMLGGNCDPVRDSWIEDGKLFLDARSKKKWPNFKRRWPDIVSF